MTDYNTFQFIQLAFYLTGSVAFTLLSVNVLMKLK